MKGRDLYYEFYGTKDHVAVAAFITGQLVRQRWIAAYDNAPEIRELYKGYQRLVYRPMAGERLCSSATRYAPLVGPLKIVKGASMRRKDGQQFSPEETQKR